MTPHLYRRYGKRLLDISVALLMLVVLSPLIIIIAIACRAILGSPVLFRQQRPGLAAKTFMMLKFRTMTDACDNAGNLLSDDKRLPAFGKFLRSSSLDELPGLLNVLKGEMSLVGPRPLLVKYLERYTDEQMRRHELRPGITGWAQVNGRNAISWEKKFEFDVWYVDHCAFWLDIKILWMTVQKVVQRKDINEEGQATQSEFQGTSQTQARP
jgi:sugar transferase EpsL